MNILLIVHSVSWVGGGAFFHALHIASGLNKIGNRITILATSKSNRLKFCTSQINGVTLIEAPDLFSGQARNGWDIYNTIRRIWYLKSLNFDVVHLLDTRPNVIVPGLFMKYIRKSKLIIEWLDWFGKGGTASERRKLISFFMYPIESFFEEKFRKFADGSIGLGIPLTNRLKQLGVKSNIITIYHGCDSFDKDFSPIDIGTDRKKTNKLDSKNIGYVGRMREDVIVRLVSLCVYLNQNYSGNFIISLIGNSAFPVKKYITPELEPFFKITGWLNYEEIQIEMMKCNLLILPFNSKSVARNNIWPSKINDYLSMGKPIVSTRLNVLHHIFEQNKIGIMCDDTEESIGKAVMGILNYPALESRFGNNGKILAKGELSWENIVQQINDFYLQVKK